VRTVWKRLRGGELSPARAGLSVAIGLFVGALPVYGFQLLIVLAVCIPLRLDAAVSYVAAHISNPLTLPLLVALEVEVGALLLTGQHASFDWNAAQKLGVGGYAEQLVCGAVLVGAVFAAAGGALVFVLTEAKTGRGERELAILRTLRRYENARPADRLYAAAKLENDPALRALLSISQGFGRVTDAGAGIGQLGLCLLELGRVQALFGFDPDARAVTVAREAARGDATFEKAAFQNASWPAADTVLFIDSLHYAPLAVQNEALRLAAQSLAADGCLIVRDVDARAGLRSAVTRLLERISARARRRPALEFRSTSDLVATLVGLGLACNVLPSREWSPFDNAIVVARRRISDSGH
jgi:uncharacterized protein (DUF2062 family)